MLFSRRKKYIGGNIRVGAGLGVQKEKMRSTIVLWTSLAMSAAACYGGLYYMSLFRPIPNIQQVCALYPITTIPWFLLIRERLQAAIARALGEA
jgi:hypothetical protein